MLLNSLTPDEVEIGFLSTHLTSDKVTEALDNGVRDDSFQIDTHAKIWAYLLDRFKEDVNVSVEDIDSAFGVKLKTGLEDSKVWLDEITHRTLVRRAQIALLTGSEGLTKDPQKAIQKLITGLSDLTHPSNSRQSYFDFDAINRFEKYMEKVAKIESGETIGIPTGLSIFDNVGDTWKPGEFVVVQGSLNVGKSWLLIYFAAYAYFYSKAKVLFLSPENTIEDINARLDPVIARFMNYELSNRDIRNGKQNADIYQKYLREIASFGRKDFLVRDSGDKGAFTIDEIISIVREIKPDLCIIDGFHLINNGGKTWENMKSSAEQIKGIGQFLGMTTIAGSQVTRNAVLAAEETPELGQTAYGMGAVEAANRVIALATTRENNDPLTRIFRVPKHRDAQQILERQFLRFDVDRGDIRQVTPFELFEESEGIDWS